MTQDHEIFQGDLKSFFEDFHPKTILNGAVIEANGKRYRTERWISPNGHCFVFIDISGQCNPEFARKPSYVNDAIKDNRIKVVKISGWD